MNEITFSINAEVYTRIVEWRRLTDYQVIKYQIETRGSAVVLHSREHGGLHQIKELPEIGSVVPYYGVSGIGYAYVFTPLDDGCAIWVESLASRSSVYAETIEPLEFRVSDRVTALTLPESPQRFDFEDTGRAFIFRITGRNFQQLAAWPAFGASLDAYSYRFEPTTVGTLIVVTQHATADSIQLDEYFG